MPNQYAQTQIQQTPAGLAGLTVSQDLAMDLQGRYGAFITKSGDQLAFGESKPGHSITKLVAIPNSPGWMTVMLGTASRQTSAVSQGGVNQGLTPQQRGAATRTRNRSRTPVGT
jgi:hypothetical protein